VYGGLTLLEVYDNKGGMSRGRRGWEGEFGVQSLHGEEKGKMWVEVVLAGAGAAGWSRVEPGAATQSLHSTGRKGVLCKLCTLNLRLKLGEEKGKMRWKSCGNWRFLGDLGRFSLFVRLDFGGRSR
jgi:hypothetical protein